MSNKKLSVEDALKIIDEKVSKKKRNKEREILLSDVIEAEIKESSIRQGFSKTVKSYVQQYDNLEYKKHKDMTSIPFVTIDGENSRDFDDAVCVEIKNEQIKIFVAIADVSYYVKKGDPVDVEARKRGNSFYFPDRVIPMLPEKLSNDVCSLLPNKVRACVVCEIILKDYKIMKYNFHRAKIISIARLTYKQVDQIYYSNKKNYLSKIIFNLFSALEVLKKLSDNRGKLSINVKEYELKLKDKKSFDFDLKKQFKSYRLVEEFMVLANNVVANFLKLNNIKSAFRNHDQPKNEKIKELKKILKQKKIENRKNFKSQEDFNFFLKNKSKNLAFINDLILKTQSKAYYDIKNIGHFGLGLEHYTHFTSPIRRYSDLLVHRDLIDILFNKTSNKNQRELMKHLTNQEKKK